MTSTIRTVWSYTIGFVLSVGLTIAAYSIVQIHNNSGHVSFSHESIILAVMLFAMLQLGVQLVFFLHFGTESKPKWNVVTFLFMLLVVVVVGGGSLWIMHNLDYNMMSGHDMNQHMMEENEKGF